MDRLTVVSAFSFQAVMFLYFSVLMVQTTSDPGFGSIANFLGVIIAVVAAFVAGVSLFFLRSHNLVWWHGLLISIGSCAVAIGLIIVVVLLPVS